MIEVTRRLKFQLWLLLLLPVLAWAAVVTQAQVVQAVLNSPNASSALKQMATSIGGLAVLESSLNTTAISSNGCCYGILQLQDQNIAAYTNMTPTQYRQAGLQTQVDAWARLVSKELNDPAVKELQSMSTFSGQTVDAGMILGCLQLGTGNCQKTLNAGSCGSGFADSNKSTICTFSDKVDKYTDQSSGSSSGTSSGTGSSGSTGTPISTVACVRDASGNCKPMDQAMADAFEAAAGFSMSQLRTTIFGIIAAGMLLLSIGIIKDVWRQYAKGAIEQHTVYQVVIRVGVCVSLVLLVMCYT